MPEMKESLFDLKAFEVEKVKGISPVKILLHYYFKAFERVHGVKYIVGNFGKDGKLAKDILNVISLDEARDLVDKFLISTDPFILNSGFTFGVFKSQINKLRMTNGTMQGTRKQRIEQVDTDLARKINWQK